MVAGAIVTRRSVVLELTAKAQRSADPVTPALAYASALRSYP